jgi:group II intron reverse transcriptase/maturase
MEVCEMQKAEIILSMLKEKSKENSRYKFSRIYRNLFNGDFYELAYSNIYAKAGNMTAGVDKQTIDGHNIKAVEKIIEQMYSETYQPKPALRKYIPKKDGKLRPLGIPSFEDKLIQEVIRLILEAIYEPIFTDSSHGFRPNRSCHSALMQIKKTCKGTNWVIEGDIKGFFDNIDHDELMKALSKKIEDGRFLGLIGKFLKAGYFELSQAHSATTGTPQGSIVSPILANVYLHEFDEYMAEVCDAHSTNTVRKRNQQYVNHNVARHVANKKGNIERAKELLKEMRTKNTQDPFDKNYIKVKYIRYAVMRRKRGKIVENHNIS